MNSAIPVPIKAEHLNASHIGRRVYSAFEPKIHLDGKVVAVREVDTDKKHVKQTVLTIEVTLAQDAELILSPEDPV